MSSTGDPSTFSFVMDAFPGYTIFNKQKEVLCAIQILEDAVVGTTDYSGSVMGHSAGIDFEEAKNDSIAGDGESAVN